MRLVTVKMPEIYVRGIDELVKAGRYSSRSEVIRIAVRELLKRELWGTALPLPEITTTRSELEAPFELPRTRNYVEIS
ncbi:MAG: ribbon-helix-helix domain-containing protein [Desulfurococcales archaeon]|nr:ribbon-helix-helix domain-containing protein [Desulfurococcales archaeon]